MNSRDEEVKIRVALVGCTGLLGDIIGKAVAAQPDIEVVAELQGGDEVPEMDADLLLWNNADESRLEQWLHAAGARCAPRVLTILGDGRNTSLWELAPHRVDLGALSVTTLVETIRGYLVTGGDLT
ncbi:Rossmann-fold NAD(P)-binding domain-containing protein [Rhodococcus wratislaviensis]|nr:hypothetical protein [Rhodococcus wratislaviensis]